MEKSEGSVSLKEFLQSRIDEYNKSHADIHILLQRSVDKTETQLSTRLEGMNEFRAQLDKQAQLFVTRDLLDTKIRSIETEYERIEDGLAERIKPLEEFQKEFTGRLLLIGGVVTALNVAIAVLSHFIK